MAKNKAVSTPVKAGKKFEKVEMPDAAELFDEDFLELASDQASLMQSRKELDDKIKENAIVLRALMEDVNDSESWSTRGEGWSASYVRPKDRESLIKELLIQQGVTMKQIEKATKKTPVTPFVTIRVAGEEE